MKAFSLFFNDETINSLQLETLELLDSIKYWLSEYVGQDNWRAELRLFGFTSYFVVELPDEESRHRFELAHSAFIDKFYHSYLDVLKENKGKR